MTTSTQSLTAWLEQCIAEDEAVARAASQGSWEIQNLGTPFFDGDEEATAYGVGPFVGDIESDHPAADAEFMSRWDPARVLAECEARRKIIELHKRNPLADLPADDINRTYYNADPDCIECIEPYPCPTLRALALPYRDRPGFREEWL